MYRRKGLDFASSKEDLKYREFYKENFEKIKAISDEVENDFFQLIEDMENEFRAMLGVE